MRIVIQSEIAVELKEIKILAVRDLFEEKRIVARIDGLPKAVVLWSGDDYDSYEAKAWTNASALERAKQKLALNPVPFDL
jgi:hypothetical protein